MEWKHCEYVNIVLHEFHQAFGKTAFYDWNEKHIISFLNARQKMSTIWCLKPISIWAYNKY